MATVIDEQVESQRVVTLPQQGDDSRPEPVKVLLVGGPMDGQLITAPVEATHVSYWVYKQPSRKSPKPEEYGNDKTMQVRYQLHPIIGNTQTWYIGRIAGLDFDTAIGMILERYQAKL